MDRDKRWDRQLRAWDANVEAKSEHHTETALEGLDAAYARGETDEYDAPTVIGDAQPMDEGDAVVFMNFRADRARQINDAYVDPKYDGYEARKTKLSRIV